jgi:16S rRNA (cytosine967-C5)-methyltransferase
MQKDEAPSSSARSSHFQKYLLYAASVISSYTGNEPFHLYLKKYFSLNKKHGSRDRKLISSLCYNYFRLGVGVSNEAGTNEKLLLSSFLCEADAHLLTDFFNVEWKTSAQSTLAGKLAVVKNEFDAEKIFPFSSALSHEIDKRKFSLSFLIQPKLFIRIRPKFRNSVIRKIKNAGFLFEELSDSCLAFSNNQKVSESLDIDKEAVVQDYSSQRTVDIADQAMTKHKSAMSIWDCCAGSGGKSILAFDIFSSSQLTVSDKRKNILEELRLRFGRAGIVKYRLATADLQAPSFPVEFPSGLFDLIIADVPCTGSGTWSRTPERLAFFNEKEINTYAALQKNIIQNAISRLQPQGYFLYLTCSVFKKENEDNVDFIQQSLSLNLVKMEYLKGYEMQADTLFAALFTT